MSVAQAAKKAVENVYGTVYTVGSASDILCKFVSVVIKDRGVARNLFWGGIKFLGRYKILILTVFHNTC